MVAPWTTPRTWSPGEITTAAQMNQLRDNLARLVASMDSYTVASLGATAFAWTASGTNPAIGNGTIVAEWAFLASGEADVHIRITMGSTTAYGSGTWLFQLPVLPNLVGNEALLSSVVLFDSSAASAASRRLGAAYVNNASAGTVALLDGATNAPVTASAPFTWAVGDIVSIAARYPAA